MIYDEKRGFAKAEPLFCIDLRAMAIFIRYTINQHTQFFRSDKGSLCDLF